MLLRNSYNCFLYVIFIRPWYHQRCNEWDVGWIYSNSNWEEWRRKKTSVPLDTLWRRGKWELIESDVVDCAIFLYHLSGYDEKVLRFQFFACIYLIRHTHTNLFLKKRSAQHNLKFKKLFFFIFMIIILFSPDFSPLQRFVVFLFHPKKKQQKIAFSTQPKEEDKNYCRTSTFVLLA